MNIVRDITDKKVTHAAVAESERRFRMLVNGVTDYAIFMPSPEGVITNWNSGARRIKGYAAEEIIGSHFSRFYTPEDAATGLPCIVPPPKTIGDASARLAEENVADWYYQTRRPEPAGLSKPKSTRREPRR